MLNRTIYEDGNGGQLLQRNNDIATTDSLAILAYLAMFGGNKDASTKPLSDEQKLNYDWWGNYKEEKSETWINSETEKILTGIVLNSRSIETITQAVKKDTSKLQQYGEIEIEVNIVSLNRVRIKIITSQGDDFTIVWDNTKNEIVEEIWL